MYSSHETGTHFPRHTAAPFLSREQERRRWNREAERQSSAWLIHCVAVLRWGVSVEFVPQPARRGSLFRWVWGEVSDLGDLEEALAKGDLEPAYL